MMLAMPTLRKNSYLCFCLLLASCSTHSLVSQNVSSAENNANKKVLHTLYIAGDLAECQGKPAAQSAAAKTAALIDGAVKDSSNNSVLTLGDSTYPNGTAQEFVDCYTPTWGRFRDLTWPSPGNHDYNTPLAANYYDYFAERAGPARRGYYSVDIAGWHIISLNSNIDADINSAQITWLRQDLAASPHLCTIAYWHHPVYTSGIRGNSPQMKTAWNILYQAGADIILAAHDHHYERFAPQDAEGNIDTARGMREFLVGTGGATLSPIMATPNHHSEAQDIGNYGILRLDLMAGQYAWQFISVSGPSNRDSGTGVCH
jgi:acid phosphatase type 7